MIEYRNTSILGPIHGCSRGLSVRRLSVVPAVAANMGPGLVPCRASLKEDIGFTLLHSRLAPGRPTDAGITVAQIETSVDIAVNYLPDRAEPQLVNKAINALSTGTGVSSHSTTAGKYYSGLSTGVGPGIHLVNACETKGWCAQGFLILTAGQQKASSSSNVGTTGWDYGSAAPAVHRQYFFSIPTFSHADSVSILGTRHRRITVSHGVPITLTPSLANANLSPLTSGESNE